MSLDVPDFLKLTQLAAPSSGTVIVLPALATSVSINYTPTPYATGIVVFPQPLNVLVNHVKVVGASGFSYADIAWDGNSTDLPPAICGVPGSLDAPYVITVTAVVGNIAQQNVATVYQLFGTAIQYVQTPAGQPAGVFLAPARTPLRQPQLLAASVSSNLAAGGSVTVVAGVGLSFVVVYGWALNISPVALVVGGYQATVEDTTAATVIARLRINVSTAVGTAVNPLSGDIPLGLPLPSSQGIKVVANAGNVGNVFVEGVIYYTQFTTAT